MTYKQAEKKGWRVRAGETGTKVEFYGEYDKSKTQKGGEKLEQKLQEMMDRGASAEEMEKAQEEQKMLFVKTYTVFNAGQIEGIEPLDADMPEGGEDFRYHDKAESIMDNCGVSIRYGSDGASYSPSRDLIKMPNRAWFTTPEFFYSTALHEIAHSTGHPSRMNREDLSNPFGSPQYAMEELRAEMASAFVIQDIGLTVTPEDMEEHMREHAAYTQNWLESLKGDYKEFYKATRDAVKIADYVLAYERTRDKANVAETVEGTKTAKTVIDIVQEAKSILGPAAIVTNAQKGHTYTGEIVKLGHDYAIQRIGADRGIVHKLQKTSDHEELLTIQKLPKRDRRVSIAYDINHRASMKKVSLEEERDSALSR
jgi:antirestriction protein ArdC